VTVVLDGASLSKLRGLQGEERWEARRNS